MTINSHFQPEVVLGAPPMHVDWVTPDGVAPPVVFGQAAAGGGRRDRALLRWRSGRRLFDVETIPHIRQDDAFTTQVLFRPRTCGSHTVFVIAGVGGIGLASGSTTVQVGSCSVSALTGSATRVGDGTDNAQVRVAGRIALSASSGPPDLVLPA